MFEALNFSYERICHVVHIDLNMKKISAKRVLNCLNVDQKRARVQASRWIWARFETTDETWVYCYDLEIEQQSIKWRILFHQGL